MSVKTQNLTMIKLYESTGANDNPFACMSDTKEIIQIALMNDGKWYIRGNTFAGIDWIGCYDSDIKKAFAGITNYLFEIEDNKITQFSENECGYNTYFTEININNSSL